jgi:diguanylate cyclase (GGDEF)-like protein
MNLSLRTKMRVLIIGLILLVGTSSIVAFTWLASNEAERGARQTAEDSMRVLRRYITDTKTKLGTQTKLATHHTAIISAVQTQSSVSILDRIERYGTGIEADIIAVASRDGYVAANRERLPQKVRDLSEQVAVIDGDLDAVWTGVDFADGKLYFLAVAPVPQDLVILGYLVAYKEIDSETAQTLRVTDRTEVAFAHAGKIVVSSRPLGGSVLTDVGELQTVRGERESYLGVYARMPEAPASTQLGFVAMRDYDSLIGPYRRMSFAFFSVLIVMLLVGLAAGERFANSFVRPIEQVARAAESIGVSEEPELIPVEERHDEIGALQKVFNKMVTAVTENRRMLMGLIDTDPLTGLINHRAFHERLQEQVRRARETKLPLSLAIIDLDHFHDYNVQHGHAAGDQQLKIYAGILRGLCPGTALLSRYRGDQFAVLLPDRDVEQAEAVIDAIRTEAAKNGGLATSVGVAQMDASVSSNEALLLWTEMALQSSKQMARNRVTRFEGELAGDAALLQFEHYLLETSTATVQALAAAVDAKDQYTKGHSERVARQAKALAQAFGCSADFAELVYLAGTLHDVGKIGIPDAILGKKGRLTEEEFEVMKTHPSQGEVIIGKVPQLTRLIPGVRHHHERWDGGGYPDGLAGENIPLMARLLAVADTFDAMTSDRPYRNGLSLEEALQEIEAHAGSQFDPRLAPLFARMMREAVESASLLPAS